MSFYGDSKKSLLRDPKVWEQIGLAFLVTYQFNSFAVFKEISSKPFTHMYIQFV